MPLNTDALKDSVNGHKPKAKRPNPTLSSNSNSSLSWSTKAPMPSLL
jgi:hypothetical protein